MVRGDLTNLTPRQRVTHYKNVCESLKLNPFTKPFDYIVLNSKLVLYARKDATDQLRSLHKVSITGLEQKQIGDLFVVTAQARAADGRTDSAMGAVPVKNVFGEQLANAMMKAETKAKRRVTLSLCGLGMTDETEVDSIPGAYYPEPDEAYVPTKERDVDDRDLVRSADERIWMRYLELLGQAQSLGLNPKPVRLPIERDELKIRGSELVEDIEQRKTQLDEEEAARIVGQAQAAAKNLDLVEAERQRAKEGLI